MALVPTYDRQVRDRPVNQTQISVSTSPATFGAGIGQAAQGLGQELIGAGEALDARDQLSEDAKAREAFGNYRRGHREAMRAPTTGYLNRTGENGLNVQDPAEQDLKRLQEQHGKDLSPRAREAYNRRVLDMQDQAHGQLLTHSSNETRNYVVNERTATIEGYVEEAATNWADPAQFEYNLGLALAEQTQLAALQGWDAATQKAAGDTLISSAFRQRIVQMAQSDPLGAQQLVEDSREVLNSEDEYALDTGMKSLVLEAQVNAIVQPFVQRGPSFAHDDPYLTMVTRAESSGVATAANNPDDPGVASADGTKTSALGPHGFLRRTYLGEVRALRAAGGAKWAEGLTDDEIAATRTDVVKEGEVFDFFRGGNQQQLRDMGAPITPVNEYALHHFGDGGGAALIRAVSSNPGADLIDVFGPSLDGILRANPQFTDMTAGEAYDWLSSHLGADARTAGGGAYFDGRAALQAAMAIEDPEVQKAALERVSTLMQMQDRANAADRKSAQEEAWDGYVRNGTTAPPMDLQRRMGQAGWTAFQSAVQNDQRGIDVTDPDVWEKLTRMASDPTGFAEANLNSYYPQLSRADRRHFIAQQEAAKAVLAGEANDRIDAKNNIDYGKAYSAADEVYRTMVVNETPNNMSQDQRAQRMDFQRELTKMVQDFFDKEQREPNEAEVRQMATVLTLPVSFYRHDAGFFGGGFDNINELGSGSFFEAANRPSDQDYRIDVEYDDIPTADRARIASQLLLSNGGRIPRPDEVTEVYEQQQLTAVGLPPNVDIATVPAWLIDVERGVNPNVTDDELVELYQQFVLSQ